MQLVMTANATNPGIVSLQVCLFSDQKMVLADDILLNTTLLQKLWFNVCHLLRLW